MYLSAITCWKISAATASSHGGVTEQSSSTTEYEADASAASMRLQEFGRGAPITHWSSSTRSAVSRESLTAKPLIQMEIAATPSSNITTHTTTMVDSCLCATTATGRNPIAGVLPTQ